MAQRNFGNVEVAVRKGQKARVAFAGLSGAGKSYTALKVAKELTYDGKILVVDTENNSASLYAGEFGDWSFDTYNWQPPYDPRELTMGINQWAKDYDAIIIDSLSAYWSDTGGLLEIVTNAGKGNTYSGWRVGTPIQNEMIQSILRADCHIFACMRAKGDTSLDKNAQGKTEVRKLGLTAIQRENTIYEMTVYGMIDLDSHGLSIEKTRCSALADRTFSAGPGTLNFAEVLREWLEGAEAEESSRIMEAEIQDALDEDVREQAAEAQEITTVSEEESDLLVNMFNHIDDVGARSSAKTDFVARFGSPRKLPRAKLTEATKFISDLVAEKV